MRATTRFCVVVTSGPNLEADFGEELIEIIGNLLIEPIEL